MSKIAFVFAGQGAQYAGMGIALQDYSKGRETFQEADDVLRMDITGLCCSGTDEDLVKTEVTQPAILTHSVATFRILREELDSWVSKTVASATAGLSIGEYSSLVISGAMSFADGLRVVKERGRLMAEAAAQNHGMMAAIMGLKGDSVVESICKEAATLGLVQPANYNCPGQIVITGEKRAVRRAMELANEAGARKCAVLQVAGAFHSPLMHPAESGLHDVLNEVAFSKPKIPFVANVTADYVEEPQAIRDSLALQLSNPVLWEASVRRMVDDGIETFVEFGPGKVLSGLIHRTYRKARTFNAEEMILDHQM